MDDGSTVIFQTGWQKNLNKKSYFMKNPGLAVSAAKYLASKKINLVGIDSPSIDLGKDGKFSVHHVLAKNNILIVENLTNLDKINSEKFHLIVAPPDKEGGITIILKDNRFMFIKVVDGKIDTVSIPE